jgi:GGDEF domain-containing protein
VAHTTCSVGFASYPFLGAQPDLVSWEQVLGIADIAMYRAKQTRNAWVGIHGEHWQGTAESLFQGLQDRTSALAAAGHVRIEHPGVQPARKLA